MHILLVPKRAYRSLMDIPKGDETFLSDVVETVQDLVRSLRLEEGGYRLIANGGSFQDVPLLHFRLVAGKETGG